MIDKWSELRALVESTLSHNVQYSHDKAYDRYSYRRVLEWMDLLEDREKQSCGFLFTGIADFDRKAWEKIMEEKGLQGLS